MSLAKKPLVSCRRAAELSGLSASYMRRLLKNKKVKGTKIPGMGWVLEEKDVASIKRQRKKKEIQDA